MAHGRLLVVEHAQPEVRAFGAEIVENSRQMGELGAGRGLGHGNQPQTESIAPGGRMAVRRLVCQRTRGQQGGRRQGSPDCAPGGYNRGLREGNRLVAAGRYAIFLKSPI